eukprot:669158-Prorocentrum_minimum.AAC.1
MLARKNCAPKPLLRTQTLQLSTLPQNPPRCLGGRGPDWPALLIYWPSDSILKSDGLNPKWILPRGERRPVPREKAKGQEKSEGPLACRKDRLSQVSNDAPLYVGWHRYDTYIYVMWSSQKRSVSPKLQHGYKEGHCRRRPLGRHKYGWLGHRGGIVCIRISLTEIYNPSHLKKARDSSHPFSHLSPDGDTPPQSNSAAVEPAAAAPPFDDDTTLTQLTCGANLRSRPRCSTRLLRRTRVVGCGGADQADPLAQSHPLPAGAGRGTRVPEPTGPQPQHAGGGAREPREPAGTPLHPLYTPSRTQSQSTRGGAREPREP